MSLLGKSVKLKCRDYGYDCYFEVEGDTEYVITKFAIHCLEDHGIEYESEILAQIIRRKYPGL